MIGRDQPIILYVLSGVKAGLNGQENCAYKSYHILDACLMSRKYRRLLIITNKGKNHNLSPV